MQVKLKKVDTVSEERVEIQTRDTMTDAEFDAMMKISLDQAKAGVSIPFEDAFDSLMKGL